MENIKFEEKFFENCFYLVPNKNTITNFDLVLNGQLVKVKVFKINRILLINIWDEKFDNIVLKYDLLLENNYYVLTKHHYDNSTMTLKDFLTSCQDDFSKLETITVEEIDEDISELILKKNHVVLE